MVAESFFKQLAKVPAVHVPFQGATAGFNALAGNRIVLVASATAGRVVQLITGSTGLDDWEWGVTLFGVHVDDLKDCVYTMRFDEASAVYGEFGPFYTGYVVTPDELAAAL